MKNYILLFSIASCVFISCGDNPSENLKTTSHSVSDSKSKEGQEALQKKLPPCDEVTSHQITLEDAATYIYNAIRSDRRKGFARKYGIGNYISFNDFDQLISKNLNNTNEGIFFYDCFENQEAFFAIRSGENCYKEYRSSYVIDDTANYHVTSLYFSFRTLFASLNGVKEYLTQQQNDPKNLVRTLPQIKGRDVRVANNDLVAELGGENFHTSHGYSFFNRRDFDSLRALPGAKGVAIFRGVEIIDNVEYDRLILIAVGPDDMFIAEDNKILERSWPPKRLKDGIPQ